MKIYSFQDALEYVLKNEGGFSNHPLDHGGATNFGITQETLARHRGHSVSIVDVAELTIKEAGEIYKRWYWDMMKLDFVKNLQVATALFDMCVNLGPIRSTRIAQFILNCEIDGHVGEETLTYLNNYDPNIFITYFSLEVKKFYYSLVHKNIDQEVFLKGWIRRAEKLLTLNED